MRFVSRYSFVFGFCIVAIAYAIGYISLHFIFYELNISTEALSLVPWDYLSYFFSFLFYFALMVSLCISIIIFVYGLHFFIIHQSIKEETNHSDYDQKLKESREQKIQRLYHLYQISKLKYYKSEFSGWSVDELYVEKEHLKYLYYKKYPYSTLFIALFILNLICLAQIESNFNIIHFAIFSFSFGLIELLFIHTLRTKVSNIFFFSSLVLTILPLSFYFSVLYAQIECNFIKNTKENDKKIITYNDNSIIHSIKVLSFTEFYLCLLKDKNYVVLPKDRVISIQHVPSDPMASYHEKKEKTFEEGILIEFFGYIVNRYKNFIGSLKIS